MKKTVIFDKEAVRELIGAPEQKQRSANSLLGQQPYTIYNDIISRNDKVESEFSFGQPPCSVECSVELTQETGRRTYRFAFSCIYKGVPYCLEITKHPGSIHSYFTTRNYGKKELNSSNLNYVVDKRPIFAFLIISTLYQRGYKCVLIKNKWVRLHSEQSIELFMAIQESVASANNREVVISDTEDEATVDDEAFVSCFFTGLKEPKKKNKRDIFFDEVIPRWKIVFAIDYSNASDIFMDGRDMIRTTILAKAREIPLINSMLADSNKRFELIQLLQAITEIHITNHYDHPMVMIKSPFDAIRHDTIYLTREYLKKYKSEQTVSDYVFVLGKCGKIASENPNHRFTILEAVKETGKPLAEVQEIISAASEKIKENAEGRGIIYEVTDGTGNCNYTGSRSYRFSLKQYRLYLTAACDANELLRCRGKLNCFIIDRARDFLLQKEDKKEFDQNKDVKHANKMYSSLMFYGIAFWDWFDRSLYSPLVERLLIDATNYGVKPKEIRETQEKALAVLSYILVERDDWMPAELRKRVFKAVYGRTLYLTQASLWNSLKSRAFYLNYAKETFLASCKFDEHQEYAIDQPFFNFIAGTIIDPPERGFNTFFTKELALYEGCLVQKKTWFLADSQDSISPEQVFQLIERCLCHIEKGINKDSLYYINALSLIFYGLANLRYNNSQLSAKVYEMAKKKPDRVVKALLYCDYFLRKTNRTYDTAAPHEEFHMMVGAIRFVCAYSDLQLTKISLDEISPDAKNDYMRWITYQSTFNKRYMYLMLKLLLVNTDFLDQVKSHANSLWRLSDYIDETSFTETSFLEYDNMDAKGYTQYLFELGLCNENNIM